MRVNGQTYTFFGEFYYFSGFLSRVVDADGVLGDGDKDLAVVVKFQDVNCRIFLQCFGWENLKRLLVLESREVVNVQSIVTASTC